MEAIQLVTGIVLIAGFVWMAVRPFLRRPIDSIGGEPLTFSRPTQYVGLPNDVSATIDARVPRV